MDSPTCMLCGHQVGGVPAPAEPAESKTSPCSLRALCLWATRSSSLSWFFHHTIEDVMKSVGTHGSLDWLFPVWNALAPEVDRPNPSPSRGPPRPGGHGGCGG